MPPCEPRQRRSVGTEPRRGIEIESRCNDVTRAGRTVDWNTDQRIGRLTPGIGMIFSDRDQSPARDIEGRVRIEPRSRRSDRRCLMGAVDAIEPLIDEVRCVDSAFRYEVCAAAVLVNTRAYIEARRSDVFDVAVSPSSHENVAAALVRTPFDPVDIRAIDRDVRKPGPLGGDRVSRDW